MNHEISDKEKYMRRCLELASQALGNTYPNPMVGAVLVHKGKIIGEGYHHKAGMPHAEINAINAVEDKSLLAESTLYVNLEPCSHYGKTPPCTLAIMQYRIPHVVIGTADPDTRVNGNGIRRLREAGCRVETGILEKECMHMNRRFFTWHTLQRPWVILKWAQTQDGFIDRLRTSPSEPPQWITDEICRMLVHKWRTEEQAILVGTKTALMDNPRLNARLWPGRQPLRLVIDRNRVLPPHLNLFDGKQETWVFTEKITGMNERKKDIRMLKADFTNLPFAILSELYAQGIQSLIIEGGTKTIQSFVKANLWDEARIFTGDVRFGGGVQAPVVAGEKKEDFFLGSSRLEIIYNRSSIGFDKE